MTHGEKILVRDLVRAIKAYDEHMAAHPDSIYMDNATLVERNRLWIAVLVALSPLK